MLGRVKSAKPEEKITVTAGTETKEVLPSSGKTIKKAIVNPTPSQSKSVTPSASQKIVAPDTGKLLNKVTVAGDSGLMAGNIKKGVNIFGVNGSFDNSEGLYAYQKYGADIYQDFMTYGSVTREMEGVSGTIIDVYRVVGGYSPVFNEETHSLCLSSGVVSKATLLQSLNKGGVVSLAGNSLNTYDYFCWEHDKPLNTTDPILGNLWFRTSNKSGTVGGIDWSADIPKMYISESNANHYIRYVDRVLGETGNVIVSNEVLPHQQGKVRKPADFWTDILGFTKVAEDRFTPSGLITLSENSTYTLSHSLGEAPLAFMLFSKPFKTNYANTIWFYFAKKNTHRMKMYSVLDTRNNDYYSTNYIRTADLRTEEFTSTDTVIHFYSPYSNVYLPPGREYTLITMA